MNTLTDAEDNPLFNHSLKKGLAVLCAFNAQQRSMTLADVAQATGMSKSSAQRLIFTLENLGFVCKNAQTRRYQLTPCVMRIGFNYIAAQPLIDLANPYLSELTSQTTETTCLTEADGLEMVYLARFISTQSVPVHMPIGSRVPMYCTGSGRAWLSALPPGEALALLRASERVVHTRHTQTSETTLLTELERVRQRGWALNREELFLGDMVLAAPVIGSHGRPVAAVHVVAPTSRWTPEAAEAQLAPALLACAHALSSAARTLG